jgi:hypothetical protein
MCDDPRGSNRRRGGDLSAGTINPYCLERTIGLSQIEHRLDEAPADGDGGQQMIIEMIFFLAVVIAIGAIIVKTFEWQQDVLYGPYNSPAGSHQQTQVTRHSKEVQEGCNTSRCGRAGTTGYDRDQTARQSKHKRKQGDNSWAK